MSVFVTTMYRYGDREKHSYVLGVWSSREIAMQAGKIEALWRGGKYEPEVTEWKVDANEFDDMGEQRKEIQCHTITKLKSTKFSQSKVSASS